ncbi:MAG: MotA/TolQ/ExbB proton channel family protein [Myxococcales bacterium]|nr:MotA/TolQ/ExbB proton channel family protein [Myxococcales bacterium]
METAALDPSSGLIELLWLGRLTTIPLAILSFAVFSIAIERVLRYRGLEKATRDLARKQVDALVRRDVATARALCEASKTPMARVFGEGLRWRNIALEDLNHVLHTSRMEQLAELRRGVWFIGTIGSLAPYIGLFGTVVGIMRSFQQIGITGDTGFDTVAAGISEALIATAVGLLVAIVALIIFNWLQTRLSVISQVMARSSERFVQALLYVESSPESTQGASPAQGVGDAGLSPA